MKMKKILASVGIFGLPVVALAADAGTLITSVTGWVGSLLGLIVAVAVLVFFWGIVQYITAGADEEKRDGARNLMIYGVIGLFVMVSIWGLVKFLGSSVGIEQGGTVAPIIVPTTTITP